MVRATILTAALAGVLVLAGQTSFADKIGMGIGGRGAPSAVSGGVTQLRSDAPSTLGISSAIRPGGVSSGSVHELGGVNYWTSETIGPLGGRKNLGGGKGGSTEMVLGGKIHTAQSIRGIGSSPGNLGGLGM